MKRLLLISGAAAVLAGRSAAGETTREAEAQQPITLEPVTVTASSLDLSPNPAVDYLVPQKRIVFEYLGHNVPGPEVVQVASLQDLKENWRPTYDSLDQFVAGVSRAGWKAAAKRELRDFYVVVFVTPRGNIAGEYYAKTDAGRKLQRWGKILLFVSDRGLRQIVPDGEVFALEQRMGYSVFENPLAHGLFPANVADTPGTAPATAQGQMASGVNVRFTGWLVFHQGELFMMPKGVKDFLFVFRGGVTPDDRLELAFENSARS